MRTPGPHDELLEQHGIEPGYHDVFGTWHATPEETARILAAAMGPASAPPEWIEPVHVLRRTQFAEGIPLHGVYGPGLRWRIVEEEGGTHEGDVGGAGIAVPGAIPDGYHRVELELAGERVAEAVLIVVPECCYQPAALAQDGRPWGVSVQLYGVRSGRNAGIGDFTDLANLATTWGTRGAAVVGTNPLHALAVSDTGGSPYSPSSRLMLNGLYVDIEAVDEYAAWKESQPAACARFAASAAELRECVLVDYAAVSGAKYPALEGLYAVYLQRHGGRASAREREFEAFRRKGGDALRLHALFCAIEEVHGPDSSRWPAPFASPGTEEVRDFERDHADRVGFHAYVQWQCATQLSLAARRARESGMALGLYADLAVSVARGGSEAWANREAYAIEASVGAPPDEFNPRGQAWGLPPLVPARLRELGYAPFVATLRANMANAGALRIDHVMGLSRLWWVPEGHEATDGAYVRYPLEDLLGILALESHRNRCLVIGEDLGTVPTSLSERLQRANVLSYRVMLFARGDKGFTPPADYPRYALVGWSTHDLPTLAGWWKRSQQPDREALVAALREAGLMKDGREATARRLPPAIAIGVHRLLARTPSALMLMQMEDVLGVEEQANVPGPASGQPNWRRRLPVALEALDTDSRVRRHARAMAKERGVPAKSANRPAGARIPRATYRLQLHKDFTFRDATALVPYLDRLGVSHVYCSPFLRARAGSTHGYDIVDHESLNPEIGTRADLEAFSAALRQRGMGMLVDIVPNHMGVMGADNGWWMDVLENGPASPYAGFFDIAWDPLAAHLAGRVLVPLLGDHYGRELAAGKLELRYEAESGTFAIQYAEHRLPLDPRTYPLLFAEPVPHSGLAALLERFGSLAERSLLPPDAIATRHENARTAQRDLARLTASDETARTWVEGAIAAHAVRPGDDAAAARLDALIEAQAWRPAYWRVAGDEINYRRFFDINGLAALRQENEAVFQRTHRLVLSLVRDGIADGLRIDHPDGLLDPRQYLERLQRAAGKPVYVVVEKIVAPHESLPRDFAAHGTTGYRFANVVNGLFVDESARGAMTRTYEAFTGEREDFRTVARRARRLILRSSLAGELNTAAQELSRIALADRDTRDYTAGALREALAEVIAAYPVYRTYIADDGPSEEDRVHIAWAVRLARREARAADATIFDFIERLLLGEAYAADDPRQGTALRFARRLQQLTSPVMAKGVEDTAFYRYNRLLSLNDVGGDPEEFGTTVTRFHRASAHRARYWPHTMLATSTHDNKRSEDVRARLDVVSENPAAWRLHLRRWSRMNAGYHHDADGVNAPSRNDEYLLYQTLLGSYPLEADEAKRAEYPKRIAAFLEKALREAKVHTSWANVNEPYETAVKAFAAAVLKDRAFLADFRQVLEPVAWIGRLNSLAIATVKLTSPGVPDIYQGNEMPDLSLVDPDNRRPVDFAARQAALGALDAAALPASSDPLSKLFITSRLLALRREQEVLFRDGSYVALRATGTKARHVLAYARRHEGQAIITVVPRLMSRLGVATGAEPCGEALWGDTAIAPAFLARDAALLNRLTGRTVALRDGQLRVADVLSDSAVAVIWAGRP
ncbi:malto-oligosyltrehalose synthase [Usitatibacter rugosus]|uniref:malto-oligosyltrehalose synthase n=1 Tax=Usitatibacter rugosus TaxID=2732067 RepID=UPI001BB2151E|nr:malto-oligosyltrehalose synthase [Usitatibacter rugosus]